MCHHCRLYGHAAHECTPVDGNLDDALVGCQANSILVDQKAACSAMNWPCHATVERLQPLHHNIIYIMIYTWSRMNQNNPLAGYQSINQSVEYLFEIITVLRINLSLYLFFSHYTFFRTATANIS